MAETVLGTMGSAGRLRVRPAEATGKGVGLLLWQADSLHRSELLWSPLGRSLQSQDGAVESRPAATDRDRCSAHRPTKLDRRMVCALVGSPESSRDIPGTVGWTRL